MSTIHFFALSDRSGSATNSDAFCAEKVGAFHLFGVAGGLSDRPGLTSASGTAIATLIGSVRAMQGSPAAALNSAVHESEARILSEKGNGLNASRDATHLSACVTDDTLGCTIVDTGEGDVLLIGRKGICIPRNYPKASPPPDPGFLSNVPGKKKPLRDMISHTLGEPHLLNLSDFVTLNIRNLFLLISSGGLHDFVKRERIQEIVLNNGENVETSCQQLVQEAQRSGSERTITIVLVHGHLH